MRLAIRMSTNVRVLLPAFAASTFALLLMLTPMWGVQARARTSRTGHAYYVSMTGKDIGSCGHSAPCSTLAYATHLSQPGDTILVEPGTYGPQSIKANGAPGHPITIKALGSVTLTRPSPASFQEQTIALLKIYNSTYLVASGFHVIGMKARPDYIQKAQPWGGEVGLFSYGSVLPHAVVIENFTVEHANNTCIKTQDGEPQVTIRNNTLIDCGISTNWFDHGIYASGPKLVIEGNHINGSTGWGVIVYGHNSPKARIENNVVTGARYWGILSIGWDGIIRNNYVHGNGGGLDIRGSKNLIANNIVSNNAVIKDARAVGGGIIFYASGNTVVNNTFYRNAGEMQSALGRQAPQGPLTIEDNIFYGRGSSDALIGSIPSNSIIDHNLYYHVKMPADHVGSHAIIANPRFVAPGKDFHLRASSPAIKAAVPFTMRRFVASPDLGAICFSCAKADR